MDCNEINSVLKQDLLEFSEVFPFSQELTGKRILVTGATGLVGSLLVRSLLKLNEIFGTDIRIIALARNQKKIFCENSIDWIIQDITTPISPEVKVDFVFHCAGITSSKIMVTHPVKVWETTYGGTEAILKFCRDTGVKSMVFLSSIESYGTFTDDKEISESDSGFIDPLKVRSCYSLGKKASENLCCSFFSEYDVPVKIARLTQTFGPGVAKEDERVFAQFARLALKGEPIILHTSGESSKPYCYTTDALSALFYILLKGENGEAYNVANPSTYISIREMARMLANKFADSEVKFELDGDHGYAPPTLSRLGTGKLENLGWKPRFSLEEMFDRLIKYLAEEDERNNQ